MRVLIWSVRAVLPAAFAALSLSAAAGCTTQAACFADCTDAPVGATGGTGATDSGGNAGSFVIGFGGEPDHAGTGGSINTGGGAVLEDAGTPCDNVDTQTDVANCGKCGNGCIFTGADAMCVKGECVIGECEDDRYDLNKNPGDGCEYVCEPTADPTEVCDTRDNDCDGTVDNGFELTTDPNNCGACGHACSLFHASTSDCAPSAAGATCVVKDCEPGWYDLDGVDANGCEYQCEKTGLNGVACDPNDANCGVERCDAFDNDCNGVINDGNEAAGGPDGGQPCLDYCNGVACKGECTAGTSTCVGKDLVCIPGKGPTQEVCDGNDNDCDGTPDNGFDLTKDPNNCGQCGVSCVDTVPNAVGQCGSVKGSPACTVLACKQGYKDIDDKVPGCEYKCPKFPTSAETCNGVDDDCDGTVDNAVAIASQKPDVVAYCNNGRPLGATPCAGTTVSCGGTSGWICNYPAASPVEIDPDTGKVRVIEALCDTFDGNCDGQKDEAFLNNNQPCSVGQGRCAQTAMYSCTADHKGTECKAVASPTSAIDELCNGIDDDCDGQIDERTPKAGSLCYTAGVSHACVGYAEPMVKVGTTWVYTYEASRPDATDTDPGIYDVRSCSKPGVLPWASISQIDAEKTCEAIPTSVANTHMHLCSEADWQAACLAGGATKPAWSYSTLATTYDDLVCNDAATGNVGPWVTAFNNGQTQRCRTSTQIWDMSGNVAEWTNTCPTVTVGGVDTQYCRVRGGSFLTQGPATACDFSFVLDVPTFLNSDLGFRCCSDVAP